MSTNSEDGLPTVAIVEDHVLVREMLADKIAGSGRYQMLWSGDDMSDLIALANPPTIAIVDLDLHGQPTSVELTSRLMKRGTAILIVSALENAAVIRSMLQLGVAGFVSKQDPAKSTLDAMDAVLAGEAWTTPELAQALMDAPKWDRPDLSERELEVLRSWAMGLTKVAIGKRLGISPHTVDTYLRRVRDKFAAQGTPVSSDAVLMRQAVRTGIIEP